MRHDHLDLIDFEGAATVLELAPDEFVLRAEPGALHHRSEFLGLTAPKAEVLAGAFGWPFRNRSSPGFHTDDHRPDRINIWLGADGRVDRAEFG